MSGTKEILDLDELRKLRLADEGYIVITGGARSSTIHRVNAKCITTENFRLKVKINERKQGGYFWVDSIATAAHEFEGARRCKVCRPEVQLVDPSTFESR